MFRTNSNYFKTHDRYFYQGSEMDKELKGDGNSYNTTIRQLDPRLGRWMSLDPVFQPHQSPYNSMDNNPKVLNDVLGNFTRKGSVWLNDFITGSLGNAGSVSFSNNPFLYKTIGTSAVTLPTIINSAINSNIDK